jgi:hypothetical protein
MLTLYLQIVPSKRRVGAQEKKVRKAFILLPAEGAPGLREEEELGERVDVGQARGGGGVADGGVVEVGEEGVGSSP